MEAVAYIACHRHYPTVSIFKFVLSESEALEGLKTHKEWQEGRYENRGPWGYEHCLHSFWDTAFEREYPVFEIHKLTK